MAVSITEYVRLVDGENYGTIVKCNGRLQYEYDKKEKKWVRSGILMEYFCDESTLYNSYEEITENEALKALGI